jgi:hypothetical protein
MCQLMGIDRLRIARAKWPNDEAAGNRRLRFFRFLGGRSWGSLLDVSGGFCLSGGAATLLRQVSGTVYRPARKAGFAGLITTRRAGGRLAG